VFIYICIDLANWRKRVLHFRFSFEPRFSEVDKFLAPPLRTTSCNVHYSGSIWQWKRDLEQVYYDYGHDQVVVMDYFSKYIEIERLIDKLGCSTVVNTIKKIFSRHGIPKELCTDNSLFSDSLWSWAMAMTWWSCRVANGRGVRNRVVDLNMWKILQEYRLDNYHKSYFIYI
jgi:hypothetical protein